VSSAINCAAGLASGTPRGTLDKAREMRLGLADVELSWSLGAGWA
jgi:hypothetical protein